MTHVGDFTKANKAIVVLVIPKRSGYDINVNYDFHHDFGADSHKGSGKIRNHTLENVSITPILEFASIKGDCCYFWTL